MCADLNDQYVNSKLCDRIESEIGRLTKMQIKALRTSTFVGMTEGEVREYQRRQKRIYGLVERFKIRMTAKAIVRIRTK